MDFKDYYASLGLSKSASAKEIKQAYRKLARKYHPDVNPGDLEAESRFKEINEAHEVLSDPETRRKYDELGANWRQYEKMPGGPGATGSPVGGQWTVNMGGGGGGYRTMSPEEMRAIFGDEDPFSDFFHTFFGFGGGRPGPSGRAAPPRQTRGGDAEQLLELSLEDAFHGAKRRLSIRHGSETRTVDVRIPAGVNDGARVRVSGEGGRGSQGGPAGDLYLRIRLQPHPRFQRRGADLRVTVAVPLTIAVLGGEAQVQTLEHQALRLKIPPGTQPRQVLRLKGHGMPKGGDGRGDLYATVQVVVPTELTPEARSHFEALAALESRSSGSAA